MPTLLAWLLLLFSHWVVSDSLRLCSPPGSSVCGISQARILEWVIVSYRRGSSWRRDQSRLLAGEFSTLCHQGSPPRLVPCDQCYACRYHKQCQWIGFAAHHAGRPKFASVTRRLKGNGTQRQTRIPKDTCTPMYTAVLFTARARKQPKCPSTEEWIKKMWDIYTMEYYSAIKWNETVPSAEMWMDLETVTQRRSRKQKRQILSINTYMWALEKWGRGTYLQGRNWDTDIEDKCMDTSEGEREWGWIERLGLTYVYYYV